MSIKVEIQEAMKDALRGKQKLRLECLRMAKGALLVLEKAGKGEVSEEQAVAALRSEVRKREQSIDIFREHGKTEEVAIAEEEIEILKEFLPEQLTEAQVEEKVKAYLTDHPEINHAGRLTGAVKKELGDSVDGKILNEVCQRILG